MLVRVGAIHRAVARRGTTTPTRDGSFIDCKVVAEMNRSGELPPANTITRLG
jgi:hypothetical protein